jgi:hypothetical protein
LPIPFFLLIGIVVWDCLTLRGCKTGLRHRFSSRAKVGPGTRTLQGRRTHHANPRESARNFPRKKLRENERDKPNGTVNWWQHLGSEQRKKRPPFGGPSIAVVTSPLPNGTAF